MTTLIPNPSGPAEPQERPVPMRHADGTPVRVLVVDDEPSLSELLQMALRYEGWDIQMAHTGRKAVAAADHVMFNSEADRLNGLRYFGNPDEPIFFRSLNCTGALCLSPDNTEIGNQD